MLFIMHTPALLRVTVRQVISYSCSLLVFAVLVMALLSDAIKPLSMPLAPPQAKTDATQVLGNPFQRPPAGLGSFWSSFR